MTDLSSPRTALPAVVLGADSPIALSIIRSLGMHGVAVHALGGSKHAIGLASRHVKSALIRAESETELILQLQKLQAEIGEACLFTISENDITLLNRHRDELNGYRLLFPDNLRMMQVLNKECTYRLARTVDIEVPVTICLDRLEQLPILCAGLNFPAVLKWADPATIAKRLEALGLPLEKSRYCFSLEELAAYLRQFEAVGSYPMVQEYCPGHGLGQFFLFSRGEVVAQFQHKRLHEWPPEGGVSSLCQSLAADRHADLMHKSIALLKAMQWEGVAMVEYRFNPANGRALLMEINGRYWGSLPLACHAGVEFPWLAYQALGLGHTISVSAYRPNMLCRFMIPEAKRLLQILFRPSAIADPMFRVKPWETLLKFFGGFFDWRMRYYVFRRDDPAPFFCDLWNGLSKFIPRK